MGRFNSTQEEVHHHDECQFPKVCGDFGQSCETPVLGIVDEQNGEHQCNNATVRVIFFFVSFACAEILLLIFLYAKYFRLADRLVFWVLKGKTVDEIYFEEKERMGASKNVTKRPSGYVNRDEYLMRLEASNKLNSSTQSMGGDGSIGSSNNLYSKSNENLNCSSTDQNRPILTNSSSKSNVGTSVLRENHDSKSAQKSAQHVVTASSNISFSGRNQKNLSPYNDKTRSTTNLNKSSKLLSGGANSSILKVKRQILFDS